MNVRIIAAALVATFCAVGADAAEKFYYRYPGADGTVVMDEKVPPEAIPRGYDVVRDDGTVVKTVPPQLTESQRKARAQEMAISKARAEAEDKLRQWDKSLLLRYSDVADIEAAKQRAMNDIKVRISVLKSNMNAIKQQIIRNQEEAAELERRGVEAPESLAQTQTLLRRELAATEDQIERRSEELEQVAEEYDRDKARFSILQDRAESYRKPSPAAD